MLEASEDGGTADPFQADLTLDWLSLEQVLACAAGRYLPELV